MEITTVRRGQALPRIFRNLSAKFLLFLVPVFLIVALIGYAFLSQYETRDGNEALAARIGNQAARTANVLAHPNVATNRNLARDMVASMAYDRAVLCAEFRESISNRLLAATPPRIGCQNSTSGYRLSLPVGEDENKTLIVRFSDAEIIAANDARRGLVLLLIATAFVVSTIFALVGFRLIIGRPLSRLHASIKQVSKTGERIAVKGPADDELGDIIEAFNEMLQRETEREQRLDKARTDILELNRSLEDRVEIRTKELRDSEQRAQAANVAKSEFLAIASHELRTPMNGVLGMARLVLGSTLSDEQRHRIEVIQKSGESLLGLLNDILDISKIESGHLEIEKSHFDIRNMMDGVAALLQSSARQKGIGYLSHVDQNVPEILVGDLARTRQILLNIVGNAIKFTESGDVRISVSHTAIDQNSAVIRFAVCDSGPGIDPQVQGRIFEKFTQADASTTRQFGGTGLGLAICKDLVELMGGQIGVDSTVGEGSTFWYTVICGIGEQKDIEDNHPTAAPTDLWAADSDRRLRILVAEDNLVNQEIAADTLRNAGHHVDLASNGLEAFNAVRRFPYDVVLMDVHMPEMDGLTATLKIRQISDDFSKLPIIALTADAMTGDKEIILAAGMNDYVSKPFDPARLHSTIARCMSDTSKGAEKTASAGDHNDSGPHPGAALDMAAIKPLRVGKPDLWKRLVKKYREVTPASLDTLEQALTEDDFTAVQMTAHSMKSSSANMGAAKLSDLCQQLETAAGEANLETGPALFEEIRNEFDIVSAALDRDVAGNNLTEISTA